MMLLLNEDTYDIMDDNTTNSHIVEYILNICQSVVHTVAKKNYFTQCGSLAIIYTCGYKYCNRRLTNIIAGRPQSNRPRVYNISTTSQYQIMVSFPTTLRHAAIAILSILLSQSFVMAEEGEQPLRVMFVNQFPDQAIDLYWENHAYSNDHPERRRLEARIAPRGGWHASETFFGHGK